MTPTTDSTRTARVEAQIALEALAVVRRAAEIQGRSLSDFRVAAALKEAHRTIEEAQFIRLSVQDQHRFAQALLNPPMLAPAMKRALQSHKRLFVSRSDRVLSTRAGAYPAQARRCFGSVRVRPW
jgi:uncharacterized protein (DUF1778 family)